jgi:hypothetical protein
MKEIREHYAVEVRDDHGGGTVWYIEEDFCDSLDEAEQDAVRISLKRHEFNGVARVIKVTHETVVQFRDGQRE